MSDSGTFILSETLSSRHGCYRQRLTPNLETPGTGFHPVLRFGCVTAALCYNPRRNGRTPTAGNMAAGGNKMTLLGSWGPGPSYRRTPL
jgi:hypothetical protein